MLNLVKSNVFSSREFSYQRDFDMISNYHISTPWHLPYTHA